MWSLRRWRSARPLLTLWGWAERACLESESRALLALSTADKGNGPRQTLSITWLQMERIISSKGQKCSLVRYWVRLQEVGVSNHLPRRKSEKKESKALKIDFIKNGRQKRTWRHSWGFVPVHVQLQSHGFWRAAFSLGHFHWLNESLYIAPPFGQRQPPYGDQLLVYWPGLFCRPLLLNFWTFLCTHTWPSKKIYSWQRTSNCW